MGKRNLRHVTSEEGTRHEHPAGRKKTHTSSHDTTPPVSTHYLFHTLGPRYLPPQQTRSHCTGPSFNVSSTWDDRQAGWSSGQGSGQVTAQHRHSQGPLRGGERGAVRRAPIPAATVYQSGISLPRYRLQSNEEEQTRNPIRSKTPTTVVTPFRDPMRRTREPASSTVTAMGRESSSRRGSIHGPKEEKCPRLPRSSRPPSRAIPVSPGRPGLASHSLLPATLFPTLWTAARAWTGAPSRGRTHDSPYPDPALHISHFIPHTHPRLALQA